MGIGLGRTANECQDRWFESLREAELRRQKVKSSKSAKSTSNAPSTSNDASNNNNNTAVTACTAGPSVKKKRMGKAYIKRLAQEASRASKDDDIFESDYISNKSQRQPCTMSPAATNRSILQSFASIHSPEELASSGRDDDDDQDGSDREGTGAGHGRGSLYKRARNNPNGLSCIDDIMDAPVSRKESGQLNYIHSFGKRVSAFQKSKTMDSTDTIGPIERRKKSTSASNSHSIACTKITSKVAGGNGVTAVLIPRTGRVQMTYAAASRQGQDTEEGLEEEEGHYGHDDIDAHIDNSDYEL